MFRGYRSYKKLLRNIGGGQMKCKNYKKVKDKSCCKRFLGHKVLELDERITGKAKYEVVESCKCRCALGKEAK